MKFIRDIIGEKRQMTEQANGVAADDSTRSVFEENFAPDAETPSPAEPVIDDLRDAIVGKDVAAQDYYDDEFDDDEFGDDGAFDDILAGFSELEAEEIDARETERVVTSMRPAEPMIAEAIGEAASLTELRVSEAIEETESHPSNTDTPEVDLPVVNLKVISEQLNTPPLDGADVDSAAQVVFEVPVSQEPAEVDAPAEAQPVDVPHLAIERGASRQGRVKTRLLGFNTGNDTETDPLEGKVKATAASFAKFPIGWLIVTDGPGRGAGFTLFSGVSKIGRGKDQTVALDFGDNSISRENHAAIAFDAMQKSFFIGHGGKANLVRRNDRPVLSTEELTAGDKITIGETTLRFVPLCGPDFIWENADEDGLAYAANS